MRRHAWRAGVLALGLGLSGILGAPPVHAGEVAVAAASDLQAVLKEVAEGFQRTSGHTLTLSFGSSGTFYAQLVNGAPFDLYFSADLLYPQKLEEAGLILPGSLTPYAIGRLVVWARRDSPLDLSAQGIKALLHPAVKKIAIANPRHAPYGRAAVAALEHFQVYHAVKDKLVLGENVSQTAQFVHTGAADIGLIALSLALMPALRDSGTFVEVPQEAYPRLLQGVVIMKTARDRRAAQALWDYVRGPAARPVFERYGFERP